MRTHRGHGARRRTSARRWPVLAIAVIIVSATAGSHQARERAPVVQKPGERQPVSINRTVPRVSAPPLRPVFSSDPEQAEISRARVFPEPLVPLGTPSREENRALAAAVNAYADAGQPLMVEPFLEFLQAHPASAWRPSLLANLGMVHKASGYYTRALTAWADAWELTHGDSSAHGRAVADMAAASALDVLAALGHRPGLDRWFERIGERALSGPAASRAARAREARAFIEAHPERVIASGPKAVEILLQWRAASASGTPRDTPPGVPAVLRNYLPTADGTSLAEVRALAAEAGVPLKAVRRQLGAPLETPAIVHLGFNHFSAVLEELDGRFRVRDPALGGERWMPREALDEEMTGYALVPAGWPAPGWAEVSEAEAAAVIGHSCPPGIPDPDECPCPEGEPGMPTYSLHPTQASVLLSDTPLGYSPPRGPGVSLQLRYNSREENQPQIFPFAHVGTRWTLNWVSYLEEVPFTTFNSGTTLAYAQPAHVAVHVPQGGVERSAYPFPDGTYPRHHRSGAVLARVSSTPVIYERRHTDGSKEVYARSDGGVPGMRRVFLTSMVDPSGQALAFTWDAQVRLVALTDALGQVTTLHYDGADPLAVTRVTDPFGRVARFTYDAAGRLETVTDVIDLPSRFVYGEAQFIAALQTPYGTTTFRQPLMTGQYNRAVEAMDPLGGVERVEFHWSNGPVPATAPPADVPPGFENRNVDLNAIMSLHWAKGRDVTNVQEATASRWLLNSLDWVWDPGWTVAVPHTVQRPGEARSWYLYTGATARPSRVVRRLPDGTVYDEQAAYNYQDHVTWTRDPVGRETTYTYAANGIDLLEVRNTTGGAHRPAGQLRELHGPPAADDDGCGGADDYDDVQRVRAGADVHERQAGNDDLREVPLHRALGPTERGPLEHLRAEIDHRGVECQQLVLEAKLLRARDRLTACEQLIEHLLVQLPRPMRVGVGQRRALRRRIHEPQMGQLALTTGQAAAYLAKRVRAPELTEQHRHELAPAREPTRVALGFRHDDGLLKLGPWKKLEQLAKNAAESCHTGRPPVNAVNCRKSATSYVGASDPLRHSRRAKGLSGNNCDIWSWCNGMDGGSSRRGTDGV